MSAGWMLLLDFGTTNTAAAVRSVDGSVRPVRLGSNADQMPSCVFADGDQLVVGEPAAMRALAAPDRFEATPKRRVGEEAVHLGGRDVPVVEIVAAVLRQASSRAAAVAGGRAPSHLVLTHPEAWGRVRRDQLAQAAHAAGLSVVTLLPEPVAAACWYVRGARVAPGSRVAVFDFGGGTCDVAVLRADPAEATGFVVEASDGEDRLGGEHVDRALIEWVGGQLRAEGRAELADQLEDPADPGPLLTLRDQVRAAKHALSEYPDAHVAVGSGRAALSLMITVEEFERLIAPDVDRAVELTRRVLDAAGCAPAGLAQFYLTGGSSLIPLVGRRLAALLGRAPATLDDPKLVVAMGAGYAFEQAPAAAAPPRRVTPPRPVPQRPSPAVPSPPRRGAPVPPPAVAPPAHWHPNASPPPYPP
ncbi:MAG TPA: Hsp70 family protein, partial [Pseudonocardia sp.]|nr:Hsp70 family protein [Pseudonocardia sp.]